MARGLRICQLLLLISFFHLTDLHAQAPALTTSYGISPAMNTEGVAFGNSVYVAIVSGTVYTSSDGIIWTRVTDASVPAQILNSLAFGSGLFVAVGGNGIIYSSANGVSWTARSSGTTNNLSYVQYLNNTAFFAVGSNNTIVRSTDGTTWAIVTTGLGGPGDLLVNVTYGNGYYLVGARGGSNCNVYRSSTGTSSWTNIPISINESANKVYFLKDSFYLFTTSANVYTSLNGASWAKDNSNLIVHNPDASTSTMGASNQIYYAFYDGTRITMMGNGSYYSSINSIYTSTDSRNFTLQKLTSVQSMGGAYLNGKSFIYGSGGVIVSDDGVNYHSVSTNYYGLATNGTTYVGVGYGSSGVNVGQIFSSADFSSWTDRTPSGLGQLGAVIYNGSKFVAAGDHTVVSSTDGLTWTNVSAPSLNFTALAYGQSVYAAGDMSGGLYSSATGASWTSAHVDDNYYYRIKYVNNNFFAMGMSYDSYTGVILQSTNGTTWTDITPNLGFTAYYFNDVVYNGSKYFFMGLEIDGSYSALGFFSVSTATPSDVNSYANKGGVGSPPSGVILGGYYGEGAFAYNNGIFAGSVIDNSSNEAYAVYSTDGVTWGASDLHVASAVAGITTNNNAFQMLGSGDNKFTASFSTLPITLLNFNAIAASGAALLTWQTALEQNSSRFNIQHSTDGQKWNSIGIVAAAGQSSSILSYRFTDIHPSNGNNYYRLALVDLDDSKTYSPIKNVWFGSAGDMKVYPNPVKGSTTIQLPGTGNATVILYSQSGQMILERIFSGSTFTLSVGNTAAGLYRLQVIQGDKTWQQALIIE